MNNKGISIALFSAKGGVGKTITTLNLAGIFEMLMERAFIILLMIIIIINIKILIIML